LEHGGETDARAQMLRIGGDDGERFAAALTKFLC
jgi:hypothetical protein